MRWGAKEAECGKTATGGLVEADEGWQPAVVLLNRGGSEAEISVPWEAIGYPGVCGERARLWAHKELASSREVQREGGFA